MPFTVSRRSFLGGLTAAVGSLTAELPVAAQSTGAAARQPRPRIELDEYDAAREAREQRESVRAARVGDEGDDHAFKYANRYGYPDGDIVAGHREAPRRQAREHPARRRVGRDPRRGRDRAFLAGRQEGRRRRRRRTARSTQHATGVQGEAITPAAARGLPAGHRRDRRAPRSATTATSASCISATRTTRPASIVTKQEIKQLLDGLPEDVPVLIDEAYHHFVEDPTYATSVPYVLEGTSGHHRAHVLEDLRARRHAARLRGRAAGAHPADAAATASGSINALVKWGGVAALKDTAAQDERQAHDDRAARADDRRARRHWATR